VVIVTEIICTFITAATAVIVAVLTAQIKKNEALAEERAKEDDEKAEVRKTESLLSMRMSFANLKLGITTSLAVTGGHTNGNVEAAQEEAEKAAAEYEDFIRKQGLDNILE
jgi:hypothetical protein